MQICHVYKRYLVTILQIYGGIVAGKGHVSSVATGHILILSKKKTPPRKILFSFISRNDNFPTFICR